MAEATATILRSECGGLPKVGETEHARKRIADLYHAAALAAWDGDTEAADTHAAAARMLARRAVHDFWTARR